MSQINENLVNAQKDLTYHANSNNKKRIVGIHGGGNIGLGLMADIVSRSDFGYQIVATSSDSFVNNLINCNHKLWLKYPSGIKSKCIRNVTMLDTRNPENVVNLYIQSNIVALCLPETGVLTAVKNIVQGLILRQQNNRANLKILILMNKPKCDDFVKNAVAKEILFRLGEKARIDQVLASVEFIPTMADRIVSKISKEEILAQIKEQLLKLNLQELDGVDSKKPIKHQVNEILIQPAKLKTAISFLNLQLDIFNVEQNFNLYVPQNFSEAIHFPSMKVVKNLDRFMEVKNKYINGPHAILAWIGALFNYSTVSAAIKNPTLLLFIKNLMEKEIAPILRAEYPELSLDELDLLKHSFIERCKINLEDPIKRVGRDPLRKLNIGACVRGIIDLRQKNKLKLPIPRLELGIAAAVLYAIKNIDSSNKECQKMHEIYTRNGSYQSILSYKGPCGSGFYFGFDYIKDRSFINNVLIRISFLEELCKLKQEKRIVRMEALMQARSYKEYTKRALKAQTC